MKVRQQQQQQQQIATTTTVPSTAIISIRKRREQPTAAILQTSTAYRTPRWRFVGCGVLMMILTILLNRRTIGVGAAQAPRAVAAFVVGPTSSSTATAPSRRQRPSVLFLGTTSTATASFSSRTMVTAKPSLILGSWTTPIARCGRFVKAPFLQQQRQRSLAASSSESSPDNSNNIIHNASDDNSSTGTAMPRNATDRSPLDVAARMQDPPAWINNNSSNITGSTGTTSWSSTTTNTMGTSSSSRSSSASSSTRMSTTSPTNNKTLDGGSLLAMDPADITIVPHISNNSNTALDAMEVNGATTLTTPITNNEDFLKQIPFVSMFRGSANYIANHRHTVAVYHIPGGLVHEDAPVFRDLMNDVALTWLLGMKLIIVVGCRPQIEHRLRQQQQQRQSFDNTTTTTTNARDPQQQQQPHEQLHPHGLRVTDGPTLRIVKEEAGYVRFEVERQLARSLRLQGSGSSQSETSPAPPKTTNLSTSNNNNNKGYYAGNVVSGNFYSAQPFGILDGVDYQYTGFVRRVETEKIRKLHEQRDICLLTTLGVSPSGEVFNVNSESLAATVAGAMEASKVVYFTETETDLLHSVHGNKIQNLRLSDARHFLQYHGLQFHRKGFVTGDPNDDHNPSHSNTAESANSDGPDDGKSHSLSSSSSSTTTATKRLKPRDDKDDRYYHAQMDMLYKIGWCTEAIRAGVKRAHIISPQHGALLQELYTRDGSGTLISADLYEGIRRATVLDVSNIHAIIAPLIAAGTLIDRPKAVLEKDIDTYYVYTRDDHIVACGQLKKFENGFAEIGCLVVNKDYRARGRGDAMLGYLERLCLINQCTNIFVLSTQTMEWFVERGFAEATVEQLPPSRQSTYNRKRASKIYLKTIDNERDLDASELWWNR